MNTDRRADDPNIRKLADHAQANQLKIDILTKRVDHLHACMERNTEITEQVRDILASFRIAGVIAKWIGAIGAAAASCIAAVKAWR